MVSHGYIGYGINVALAHEGLKENNGRAKPDSFDQISGICKPAKALYCRIKANQNLVQKNYDKFVNSYKLSIDYDQFISWVQYIKKITICSKLRSFQYRLLMGGIITNIQLKYYGIKESDTCSFCSLTRETCIHLFAECQYTKAIWNGIAKLFENGEVPSIEKIMLNNV